MRLRDQLGLEGIRLHDLHHYVATHLLEAGVPVRAVSERSAMPTPPRPSASTHMRSQRPTSAQPSSSATCSHRRSPRLRNASGARIRGRIERTDRRLGARSKVAIARSVASFGAPSIRRSGTFALRLVQLSLRGQRPRARRAQADPLGELTLGTHVVWVDSEPSLHCSATHLDEASIRRRHKSVRLCRVDADHNSTLAARRHSHVAPMRKASPPNIFFSVTSDSPTNSSRMRSARFSS